MWSLRHQRENKWYSLPSYDSCVMEYYNCYRDDDGSIPWDIYYYETNLSGFKPFNYRFGENWQTLYAVWISRK